MSMTPAQMYEELTAARLRLVEKNEARKYELLGLTAQDIAALYYTLDEMALHMTADLTAAKAKFDELTYDLYCEDIVRLTLIKASLGKLPGSPADEKLNNLPDIDPDPGVDPNLKN